MIISIIQDIKITAFQGHFSLNSPQKMDFQQQQISVTETVLCIWHCARSQEISALSTIIVLNDMDLQYAKVWWLNLVHGRALQQYVLYSM